MNRIDELRASAANLSAAHGRMAPVPAAAPGAPGPGDSAPIVFLDFTGGVLTALLRHDRGDQPRHGMRDHAGHDGLVGRRLEVNPLLIFLALWFGSLYWGIPGIVLATPALVALKVVSENTISGQSIVRFLGPNNQSPDRDRKLERLKRSLS